MTAKNIDKKVQELKELQRMSEELNAEMESIKDELKAEMLQRDVEELNTDTYKLRFKEVASTRFDSKSFKAKYAELYNQFCKVTSSKRFKHSIGKRLFVKADQSNTKSHNPPIKGVCLL